MKRLLFALIMFALLYNVSLIISQNQSGMQVEKPSGEYKELANGEYLPIQN